MTTPKKSMHDRNPIKVCLIEDDPEVIKLIRDILAVSKNKQFSLSTSGEPSICFEHIIKNGSDIILLDLNFFKNEGLKILQELQNKVHDIPIIIITDIEDEDIAVRAVKMGAQDYLIKGEINGTRLIRAILYAIERKNIQVKLERLNRELIVKERDMRGFIEKSLDGIIIADIEGKLIFINSIAEKIIGCKKSELNKDLFETFLKAKNKKRVDILKAGRKQSSVEYKVIDIQWQKNPAYMILIHDTVSKQGQTLNAFFEEQDGINRQGVIPKDLIDFAKRDPLTGLPNRIMFREELQKTMKRAIRNKHSMGILVIDLDNFKLVNDTLGHTVGDKVLEMVSERMLSSIREVDTLARIGGDEFLLMLENIEATIDTSMVADRIIEILSRPFDIDGQKVRIGSSIGISIFPDDASEPEALFRKADIAMYQAKADGKNRYCFFTKEMEKQLHEKATLSNQIHNALENNEFKLLYQPQVDIKSGKIIGVEALLRWYNPERGMVTPDVFIPLLEETGLIVPVGRWVIDEACRQSHIWCEKGLPEIIMSVNCSPMQFRDMGLIETIRDNLDKKVVRPDLFEIEITEGLFMEDKLQIYQALREIRSMGVSIVMDDFGTGYSSLSYLKRFPIDGLKIDRVFVDGILKDPGDMALVSAITGMAIGLNLNRIVAEGVEDEKQIPLLRQMGCDCYQGFFFSRPVPPDEIETLLLSNEKKLKSDINEDNSKPNEKHAMILIAEDNPVNQRLTSLQLKKEGHEVDIVSDGAKAVEAFRNYPFYDLILMDIQMPEMDGFTAAKYIRKLEQEKRENDAGKNKRKRIPIIALSAYSDDTDSEKKNNPEIDDFLMKPVKREELLALVQKWSDLIPV